MTKYCCYFCSFLGFQAHYSALISHLSAYLPHHLRGLYTAVAIGVFYQNANVLREPEKKQKKSEPSEEDSDLVPRPGLEPGWVAPLVFETSASTDSAIWAISECKGTNNI